MLKSLKFESSKNNITTEITNKIVNNTNPFTLVIIIMSIIYISIVFIILKYKYFYSLVEDCIILIKEKKNLTRKYVYFFLIRLDYYIIFLIYLFKSEKKKAFGIYFGNYYYFFFFIQPILYLWLGEEQKSNIFLTFKFFLICLIIYSFFILIENILLPYGVLFSLFYIPIFALFIYIEGNFKIAYKSILKFIYKDSYFQFFSFHSDKFYFEKNVNKLKKFREEINNHSKKVKISIFKNTKKKKNGRAFRRYFIFKKRKKTSKTKNKKKKRNK